MPKQPFRNPILSNIFIWLLVFIVAWAVWNFLVLRHGGKVEPINYSQFLTELNNDNIKSVVFTDKEISGSLKQESYKTSDKNRIPYKEFKTTQPSFDDPEMVSKLKQNNVSIIGKHSSPWSSILISAIPWVLFIGIWIFFIRRMSQGSDRAFSFGKSKARLLATDRPKTTFEDVAGVDEAKDELKEVIEFLKSPQKFQKLGGKIPKGVLLVGPTGTGKTLLARAVAGEAGVPFLSISGSDFVEMFVGVGAARVRDLFEQGKRNAPCIIFIDEIDAVGRQRGAGVGGGNDEREQTLNQLLAEMDGFEKNKGIVVIAATNRADILDNALLRPGRFDRQVTINSPDKNGREAILKIHARNKKLTPDISLEVIAQRTPGFGGADLANVLNEAAIITAREEKSLIGMEEINAAIERVIAGLEGPSITDNKNKRLIAYHEAGHAITATLLQDHDSVQTVTLVPRGQAKGLTWFIPNEDPNLITRSQILSRIIAALGGRAAEEVVFGDAELTTGASGDLTQVKDMAKQMVTRFGMSPIGPIALGNQGGGFLFVGRGIKPANEYSDSLATKIDTQIKAIVELCYAEAIQIMESNRVSLDKVVTELIDNEVLSGKSFEQIISKFSKLPPNRIYETKLNLK